MADDVKITLRLPSELHRAISDMAAAEQRSLNKQIVWLLNQAVSQHNQEGDPT